MNWFNKLWLAIVSTNDDPYLQTIKKLEKQLADCNTLRNDTSVYVKELEMELKISLEKAAELKEIVDFKERETQLEAYWNGKRPKNNSYKYSARPPLDGDKNTSVDPRIFFNHNDSVIPIVRGDSPDEIANNALLHVIDKVTYTTDPTQFKKNEAWLFPFETLKLRKGDCEDGAILLANIMIKSGIPYWRVRLNAGDVQGGGHCWVTYLTENNLWVVLDWCYWPRESLNLKKTWKKAEKYFDIWFSWNEKYIFKGDTLDR